MAKLISHKYDKNAIVFGYNTMVYPRNSDPITDDEIAEFYELLKALKVPQLKVICKERELMVSGKKGELIRSGGVAPGKQGTNCFFLTSPFERSFF